MNFRLQQFDSVLELDLRINFFFFFNSMEDKRGIKLGQNPTRIFSNIL